MLGQSDIKRGADQFYALAFKVEEIDDEHVRGRLWEHASKIGQEKVLVSVFKLLDTGFGSLWIRW